MAGRKAARDVLAQAEAEQTGEEILRQQRREEKARAKLRESRAALKALEKELALSEKRNDILVDLTKAPTPKPFKVRKRRGQGKRLPAATYVAMASDWHLEERVRPETVRYLNEYNPEIAHARARQFFKSNLTMLNVARAAWDVRDMVFWIGGDIITGYIHEEYEEENFMSPNQAVLFAYEVIGEGIETLLAESDVERLIIPTSHGNHGRQHKKPRVATAAKNSNEWLLYKFLEMQFADEPRVEFRVADGYNNPVDLYGQIFNFHHGEAIKYAGGVGGPAVPVNRRVMRQAKSDPAPAYMDVFGHFHCLMRGQYHIQNGSLIGWNPFAEQIGAGFEPPMQGSFVVDAKHHLVNNFNPILVEK